LYLYKSEIPTFGQMNKRFRFQASIPLIRPTFFVYRISIWKKRILFKQFIPWIVVSDLYGNCGGHCCCFTL